jgi:hypothetical protein
MGGDFDCSIEAAGWSGSALVVSSRISVSGGALVLFESLIVISKREKFDFEFLVSFVKEKLEWRILQSGAMSGQHRERLGTV